MKIKSLVLAISILGSSLTFANCKEKYIHEAKNNTSVSLEIIKMDESGYALPLLGYTGAALIFGTSTAALIGYSGLPLALVLEHLIEDAVKDHKLMTMVRLVNESEIELGLIERPQPNPHQKIIIPVDGKTKKERRAQRKQNRQANREARVIERANKRIIEENSKAQAVMNEVLAAVQEELPEITKGDLADTILKLDSNNLLCDGTIRLAGKDLEYRTDTVKEDGPTKKELRKQRRHNREVMRHNDRISNKKHRKRFAFKKHLIKYLTKNL